jgi:hypothetical protein
MPLSPHPHRAMVIAHDPSSDSMYVMLSTGQITGFPVRRLYHGTADGMRINKPPLPVKGSWGLVIFPSGDARNGVWLGSYPPNMVDAIPNEQDDPFCDYHSHYSGHWSFTHGISGYMATQFADGSYAIASSGSNLLTTHRHTVDDQQKQQRVEFKWSDRNPNPQPTFAYTFVQSGTQFSVYLTGAGSTTVTFNQGQTLTIQQSGTGTTWNIDGDGNITFSTAGTVTITGSKQITMTTQILEVDASDHVTVNTPLATFSGDIHAKGAVIAGYGSGGQVGLQTHQHDQPPDSHLDAEQRTNAPAAGT